VGQSTAGERWGAAFEDRLPSFPAVLGGQAPPGVDEFLAGMRSDVRCDRGATQHALRLTRRDRGDGCQMLEVGGKPGFERGSVSITRTGASADIKRLPRIESRERQRAEKVRERLPMSTAASTGSSSNNSNGNESMKTPDRPEWTADVDNPYLQGIHAPMLHETSTVELEVAEGEIPTDLCGAFVRNGPNAVFAPTNLYHWFDGDGMIHSVTFRDGQAHYTSRLVETKGLADERSAGHAIWPGIMGPFDFDLPRHYLKDTANTDVIFHNGQLLALWYMCGEPYRVDPLSLETLGVEDFGGKLASTVSAHPKVDERTGELVYFTLSDEAPFMRYGVVSKDGDLVHETPIDLPGPRATHDITITENYSILHDFPFFHDAELQQTVKHRIARFHRELPSRFGVLPRRGSATDVRWFEFEPGYVLHMVNAWEEGDWIVMDGCFQPDPTIARNKEEGHLASMLGYLRIKAHLRRWRMNLVTGETREEQLDDLNVEFCLPDTDLYGQRTRYSYHQHLPLDMYTVDFHALVKYDHEDGSCRRYDYGEGIVGGEAPFARRSTRPGEATSEDDGYVVTLVTDSQDESSECWVFSATDVESGPIARLPLPQRVPPGFHAKWIPGERLFSD
jgi:carotenoid cleavage dioxygenase-like enzyme